MQVVPITPTPRFSFVPKTSPGQQFQKPGNVPFITYSRPQFQQNQNIEFDGKRLRKAVTRKTVDYNTSVLNYLQARVWQRDYRDRRVVQPDPAYYTEITPPLSMPDNPINAVTTKFVRTSTNKMRCPIFCVAWTPEGRRLVTGASSGEFTLWNGLTFNFETILQAHDSPVRCMVWSHNDVWMVTGDHAGYVKYWQSNMNNVKMFQGHKEPLRAISFCPMDTKFVTCSDDGTVRIWDFLKCVEEKILRGHGADVKCVDWHPQKSLIVSGSKDSQQPIKLWDPKSGQSLATVHAHKNTVMDIKWNKNGNWLLTSSRDHLIKLFDIRNMNQEMQTFRGHKKEATTVAWHPVHEGFFSSGGSDGCVMFWNVGADKEVGCMEQAHDSCVWSLAWHPLGHILCSGSNDHSSKFWTRNRPGDRMRDKYNLNTLPKGQDETGDYDDASVSSAIPGMGLEHGLPDHLKANEGSFEPEVSMIPGLDLTSADDLDPDKPAKKTPFAKPIPKQFQQQWMESKQSLLLAPPDDRSNGEMVPPPSMPPAPPMMMHQEQQHFQQEQQHFQQEQQHFQQEQQHQHFQQEQQHQHFQQEQQHFQPEKQHFQQHNPQHRQTLLGEHPMEQQMNPPEPHNPEGQHFHPPPRNDQQQPPHRPPNNESWQSYGDAPMEVEPPPENDRLNNGFAPQPMYNDNYNRFNEQEDFCGPPRFGGDFRGDPRNHHPPEQQNFNHPPPPPHKRFEDNFYEEQPPPDFNNRGPPPPFFRGRARGPFRGGRSPFRIINRGRGRGGYPS